jgi:hypothetical protein
MKFCLTVSYRSRLFFSVSLLFLVISIIIFRASEALVFYDEFAFALVAITLSILSFIDAFCEYKCLRIQLIYLSFLSLSTFMLCTTIGTFFFFAIIFTGEPQGLIDILVVVSLIFFAVYPYIPFLFMTMLPIEKAKNNTSKIVSRYKNITLPDDILVVLSNAIIITLSVAVLVIFHEKSPSAHSLLFLFVILVCVFGSTLFIWPLKSLSILFFLFTSPLFLFVLFLLIPRLYSVNEITSVIINLILISLLLPTALLEVRNSFWTILYFLSYEKVIFHSSLFMKTEFKRWKSSKRQATQGYLKKYDEILLIPVVTLLTLLGLILSIFSLWELIHGGILDLIIEMNFMEALRKISNPTIEPYNDGVFETSWNFVRLFILSQACFYLSGHICKRFERKRKPRVKNELQDVFPEQGILMFRNHRDDRLRLGKNSFTFRGALLPGYRSYEYFQHFFNEYFGIVGQVFQLDPDNLNIDGSVSTTSDKENWFPQVQNAIQKASAIIVLMEHPKKATGNVRKEISEIFNRNKMSQTLFVMPTVIFKKKRFRHFCETINELHGNVFSSADIKRLQSKVLGACYYSGRWIIFTGKHNDQTYYEAMTDTWIAINQFECDPSKNFEFHKR